MGDEGARGAALSSVGGQVELAAQGMALVRWTRQGELLVALERSRGVRLRMVRDGRGVSVNTDALPMGRIRSLAIAPDGGIWVAMNVKEASQKWRPHIVLLNPDGTAPTDNP